MSVRFRDYYEILGVPRDASAEQIRSAYRKLARKHHPDVNKGDTGSEEKLKEINEAYEVLKDPEKRRKYDQLGANWRHGQEFTPPPGFGSGAGGAGFNFGGFSDFFAQFFGDMGGGPAGMGGRGRRASRTTAGPFGDFAYDGGYDVEPTTVDIDVPVDEVVRGGVIKLSLGFPGRGNREFELRIPRGIAEGKKIRMAGQGDGGGDLLLTVRYAPGEIYRWESGTLVTDARITPAVAVLGGKTTVQTPDGPIALTIPPGTNSGRRLRVRGKGLEKDGVRGDLLVNVLITVPARPTAEQRALYEQLAKLDNA
jgi:curved DNA-binding protein